MEHSLIRVLLIDDDEDDYLLTRDLFAEIKGNHLHLEWVNSYAAGLEEMRRQRHDLYLVDYRLGAQSGLQLLEEAVAGGCNLPIIILTGQGDHEVDVQAMKRGAADYLIKGQIDPLTLERAIRYALEHARVLGELRRREEHLQALLEHGSDVITILEADGTIRYQSPSIEKVLGYTPAETVGQNVLDFVHPEDLPTVRAALSAGVRRLRSATSSAYRFRHRNGSWRFLESIGSSLLDNPLVAGIVVNSRDVTERVQAEQALRMERQRLDLTLRSIADGVVALDDQGHILLANQVGCDYLNLLSEEGESNHLTRLGGLPLTRVLAPPPEGRACHEITVEHPCRRVFEVTASPMPSEGKGGGWVLVVREVTQQREMQERIQAQDRLAAIGQLAAGIAHDFNNILQSILGYAELTQKSVPLSHEARQYLTVIQQQGQRAAQLVRQILDFSRKSLLQPQETNLLTMLQDGTKLLRRLLPENIEISLETGSDKYLVQADQAQLQQALTNLVINARDAMPAGGRLHLRLSSYRLRPGEQPPIPAMPPGNWILLQVADTGQGIPAQVMPHIFEPFFTTKHPGEGSGLGLAQVYGIVQQHQGFIDVASEVGQGTVFSIYLPALGLQSQAALQPDREDLQYGDGQRLLLVEDEQVVLQITREMLECLGYQVLTARNGREALQVLQRYGDEIALVITDVAMPEMGGLQLVRALREQNNPVKVVVMSGYPLKEEWRTIWKQEIEGWVTKPISLQQLGDLVKEALGSERNRHPENACPAPRRLPASAV